MPEFGKLVERAWALRPEAEFELTHVRGLSREISSMRGWNFDNGANE